MSPEEVRRRNKKGIVRNPFLRRGSRNGISEEDFLKTVGEKCFGYCRLEGIERQGITLYKKKR